jgi:2-oxoisovalerate dehydrogenase E1 component
MADKDGGWMRRYPDPSRSIRLGEVGIDGAGTDLAIVTFGNGCYLSHQARATLAAGHQGADRRYALAVAAAETGADVAAVAGCRHILIVDETRHTGGVAEGADGAFPRSAPGVPLARLTAEDSFIATGPAYAATMPSAARHRRGRIAPGG